ncbi:MAG TPA: peptidylprolyl isomerase [Candidatus Thermoplasmatota archaeon]|nr:peptidylprolyl isomerase [Candidatus Thermoplasmatota archaeon]
MRGWPAALIVLLVPLGGCATSEAPGAGTGTPDAVAQPVERDAILFQTEAGPITVLLYPEAAPKTVALMQQYVAEGYYVGRWFGRTVPGHVIQVAEPTEHRDDPRRVPLETSPAFHFSAGAVGTARGADPGSGGPELFIMDYATSHLDGNYTVWGQVLSGLAVVHDIATRPAIDSSVVAPIPGAQAQAPFDRMAVVPVRITATQSLRVSLPPEAAAHLPLQVARNVRAGDLRHSLEYPADLHAGAPAHLTWYARGYDGAAAPTQRLEVRDNGTAIPLAPASPGVYPFDWTPSSAGPHTLAFVEGGNVLARLQVDVPRTAPPHALA